MEQSPSWKLTVPQLVMKFLRIFMEPEGLLPQPQTPHPTCPYLEPDQSSPFLPITLFEDPYWYYSPIYS